jgi:hypothetical protein
VLDAEGDIEPPIDADRQPWANNGRVRTPDESLLGVGGPGGEWRAQVRREGHALSKTFVIKDDADARASETER